MKALSLAIVGADFPNKRGPGRRMELLVCAPGEAVDLVLEPKNPADPNAVAVFSCRGVQLGYLTAERAPWIGKMMREGREIAAIFQAYASFGGWARVAFDGEAPVLPLPQVANDLHESPAGMGEVDPGFWPDPIYDD